MEDLGEAERAKLFERFGRSFDAGTQIYAEGDAATHCHLIQEGRVRLVKRIRSSERSLTVLRPGDLFGEDALLKVFRKVTPGVNPDHAAAMVAAVREFSPAYHGG